MYAHIRSTEVTHGGFSFGVHTTYDHEGRDDNKITTDKLGTQLSTLYIQDEAQDSYGRCQLMQVRLRSIPLSPVWARDAFLSRVAAMLVEG